MNRRHLSERFLALLLAPLVLVVLAIIFVCYLPTRGNSFLYRSERMKSPTESFTLFKIRTMHPPLPSDDESVLGGDQSDRVTPLGGILRKTRLDELPQIFNVLRGDIGFVGPRPPLRRYVDAYPGEYARVLKRRPGVTGLATVFVCRREERLLSTSQTPAQTDLIYRRSCIPWKTRLDLFFADHASPALYGYILFRTVFRRRVVAARKLRRGIALLERPKQLVAPTTTQSFPKSAET